MLWTHTVNFLTPTRSFCSPSRRPGWRRSTTSRPTCISSTSFRPADRRAAADRTCTPCMTFSAISGMTRKNTWRPCPPAKTPRYLFVVQTQKRLSQPLLYPYSYYRIWPMKCHWSSCLQRSRTGHRSPCWKVL